MYKLQISYKTPRNLRLGSLSTSLALVILLQFQLEINCYNQYYFPPSIVTFDERFGGPGTAGKDFKNLKVGLNFPFGPNGAEMKMEHREMENPQQSPFVSDDADYILPLCCNMVKDDVISYECQNSLSVSSKEVVFKRKTWIAPKHLVSTKTSTKFKFATTSLSCKYSGFAATLSLNSSSSSTSTQKSYFQPDGYLKYNNEYYRPDEYCISGLNYHRIEVQVCHANCSDPMTPCIHKCCGLNQIYSFGYGDNPRGCVDVDLSKPKWYPTLYHNLETKLSNQEMVHLNPHIVHKFPTSFKYNCRFNKTTVFPHGKGIAEFLTALTHKNFRNLEFHLRKDGWLLYPGQNEKGSGTEPLAKQIENYCIDGAQDYGESSEFSNLEGETVLFLCSGGVDEAFETKVAPSTQRPNSASTYRPIQMTPRPSRPPSSPQNPGNMNLDQFSNINNFKDSIEVDLADSSSSSSSLEIEIEDGVPLNSIAMDSFQDTTNSDKDKNPESETFIPAVLKIAVQVPQPPKVHPVPRPVSIVPRPNLAQVKNKRKNHKNKKPELSQTIFNHNNINTKLQDQNAQESDTGSEVNATPKFAIPTCCQFAPDVNDGFTHHCRNRRMADKLSNGSSKGSNNWNVPPHFMTRDRPTSFSLKLTPVTCGPGRFQFQGFIHNFEQAKGNSPGEKKHGILSDGYLKYDNEFYSPDQYCVNGLSPRIVEVLICKPDCSMWESPCIQKCCGLDEIYNLGLASGNRGCQPLNPNESRFNPTLYKSMKTPVPSEEMKSIQPHFVQKYPPNFQHTCFNKITLAFPFSQGIASKLTPADSAERGGTAFKHLHFRFRKDGKLIYSYPESEEKGFDSVYDRGEYCVDAVRDYGESDTFRNNENQTILFICASEPHSVER